VSREEEVSDDEDIAEEVLRAIRRIVRRISEHSRFLSREVGLTVPQLLVLRAIGTLEHDEITLAIVSREVQLSPATVSRIIDRLERAGLVSRERRATDRRKVCLSLTPAGLDRFETLPTPLQETFVARLAKLSARQRTTLLRSLERVIDLMEAEDLDAAPILTPEIDPKDMPPQ
jgi:DNA-binding MarR family transcriptional regulator